MNKIAIVCCYFNFCNYDKIRKNYYAFKEHVLKSTHNLYTVELTLKDQDDDLVNNDSLDKIIRVKSNSVLWHKERLIQIGIDRALADGFDKVVWSDADVIFKDSNWLQNISTALDKHDIVQCFDSLDEEFNDRTQSGESALSFILSKKRKKGFAPGGCWAATKDFLQNNRLYDKCICGGGDNIFLLGCIPSEIAKLNDENMMPTTYKWHSKKLYDDYCKHLLKCRAYIDQKPNRVGVVRQKILCLPHGTAQNRNYQSRHAFLYNFDPDKDIYLNKDNVYELADNCTELRNNLRNYFQNRDEDVGISTYPTWATCKTNEGQGSMTKILGLSGKKQSGKNAICNWLHCMELTSLKVVDYAKLNHRGEIVVPSQTPDGIQDGILDITSKKVQEFLDSVGVSYFIKYYSFADNLKAFCINILGLPRESVYGTEEQKNQPTHLEWGNMPGIITEETLKNLKISATAGKNIRNKKCEAINCLYHVNDYMTGREVLQWFGTDICRKIYQDCWIKSTIKNIQNDSPLLAVITDIRFSSEVEAIQKAGGRIVRLTRQLDVADEHSSEAELDNYTGFDYTLDNAQMSITEQNKAITELLQEWKWISYVD
jgi:hypothetical protein